MQALEKNCRFKGDDDKCSNMGDVCHIENFEDCLIYKEGLAEEFG